MQSRPFAPHLATFGDLIQTFDKGAVCVLEGLGCPTFGVHQLNQRRPEPASRSVYCERFPDHVLGFVEEAVSDFKHDSFEVDLPLGFYQFFCLSHYLAGTLDLALHLEILSVLKQRQGYLLLRYLNEASLYQLSRLRAVAKLVLTARGDKPDLPLKVVWACEYRIH